MKYTCIVLQLKFENLKNGKKVEISLSLQSLPMLRQNIKFISKRLSVKNSYRNLRYFVKVKCRSFDDTRTNTRTNEQPSLRSFAKAKLKSKSMIFNKLSRKKQSHRISYRQKVKVSLAVWVFILVLMDRLTNRQTHTRTTEFKKFC